VEGLGAALELGVAAKRVGVVERGSRLQRRLTDVGAGFRVTLPYAAIEALIGAGPAPGSTLFFATTCAHARQLLNLTTIIRVGPPLILKIVETLVASGVRRSTATLAGNCR